MSTLPVTVFTDDSVALCFDVLRCAESVRMDVARVAAEANLQIADFIALRTLISNVAPLHPSELADALRCSRPYVTVVIQRLLVAGLIEEHPVPLAGPTKTLSVTKSGREVYATLFRRLEEEDPFICLLPWDRAALAKSLERFLFPELSE